MYPVADGRNIYPDGAASLLSVLIFEALKINIGFNDNPPAGTNVSIVVFIAFSPLTVGNDHSPLTPMTFCICGMSQMPHSSTFQIWFGEYSSFHSLSHPEQSSKNFSMHPGFAAIALPIDKLLATLSFRSGCLL